MFKKYLPTIITAAVLIVIIIATVVLLPKDRFKKPQETGAEKKPVVTHDIYYNKGMLLCGVSEAPYTQGDIKFFSYTKGTFRYKDYPNDQALKEIEYGFDASSWEIIGSDGIISGTDSRNITVALTDDNGIVKEYANFEYIPGVIYGYSNPDQYDDELLYNKENPSLEDERAVKLASNLFKSSKNSYYNSEFGCIIQGYLSKYSNMGGMLEDYYHTGTDFTIMDNQSFYSPVDGVITYATQQDDYNMIIIYNAKFNISVIILHGADITPANTIFTGSGEVKKGDKLGTGGGKGNPTGDTHIHIEVRVGKVERYKSFSKDIIYTRMTNYDPLVLADMFNLTVLKEDTYEPFSKLSVSSFDARNNASVVQVNNWLYYVDKENGSAIYKARPNGTEITKLVDSACANVTHYDGWLYYSNLSKNGVVMKTSLDGKETLQVSKNNSATFVQVTDEWIYFANALNKNALFRVRLDGSEETQILRKDISDIFYFDGGIYYTQDTLDKRERIYRFDVNTLKATQLLPSRADNPFVYNGQLCFRGHYSDKNCLILPSGVYDEASASVLIPTAYNEFLPGHKYFVFTNENDGESIYVKFEGKNEIVKLSNDVMCTELTFQGGWLYYYGHSADGHRLTRTNLLGMKKQYLTDTGNWIDDVFDAEEGFEDIINASRTNTEFPSPLPDLTPIASSTPAGVTPYPTPAPTPDSGLVTSTPVPETETPQVTATPDITPEPTAKPVPEETPESTGEPTPEATPESTGEPTPETTPETTPESTGEPTPEQTPELTPEQTSEPTLEPAPTVE